MRVFMWKALQILWHSLHIFSRKKRRREKMMKLAIDNWLVINRSINAKFSFSPFCCYLFDWDRWWYWVGRSVGRRWNKKKSQICNSVSLCRVERKFVLMSARRRRRTRRNLGGEAIKKSQRQKGSNGWQDDQHLRRQQIDSSSFFLLHIEE